MADLVALHAAVVETADKVARAGPAIVGYHPASIAVGTLAALALGAVSIWLFRVQRHEKRLGAAALSLAVSMMALVLSVTVLVAGINLGIPHKGATPAMLAARDDACSQVLGAIRTGNVRWMEPGWQKEVSDDCGAEQLALAANAPASRYASKM